MFGVLELCRHRQVPAGYEHSNSKNRGPSDRPPKQNDDFIENSLNVFN
jgi:hypothetical protein